MYACMYAYMHEHIRIYEPVKCMNAYMHEYIRIYEPVKCQDARMHMYMVGASAVNEHVHRLVRVDV